jgi:hypothetical protein
MDWTHLVHRGSRSGGAKLGAGGGSRTRLCPGIRRWWGQPRGCRGPSNDCGGRSCTARVGTQLLVCQTDIASNAQSSDPSKRDLLGLGVRYRLGWQQCCGSLHPFLAVPVQVLHSSIQDTSSIVAELASHSVPTPPPEVPSQDQPGSAWGWGAGLELGLGLALADNLSGQTGLQGIYHDIYSGVSSHTAWTWHLGLSYGF